MAKHYCKSRGKAANKQLRFSDVLQNRQQAFLRFEFKKVKPFFHPKGWGGVEQKRIPKMAKSQESLTDEFVRFGGKTRVFSGGKREEGVPHNGATTHERVWVKALTAALPPCLLTSELQRPFSLPQSFPEAGVHIRKERGRICTGMLLFSTF
ncbi:hypothetical protein CEXT_735171 [Caerostris extrusa]|uniref:Uncharacterized protein n=1 Tax=Caerostris extrusa TaxID=172846 RepID=A0AAV4UVC7_CAEEX|nr:hypothetical protein CEXT_735171 [Caerostris extrusa]